MTTSKAIRLNEWLEIFGKWVHFQLQPPKDSHVVTLNACDGRLPWKGEIYASAAHVNFASDARLVDVRYCEPDPEDNPIEPEFTGGRFLVTLQLPTIKGVIP